MKKDRNTFFESSQMASSFMSNPIPNMFNMQQPVNYQMANNTSNFYSNDIPLNTYPSLNNYNNDLDTKIARIQRQIQKLEARISKLENNTSNNDDVNITSNMYML